jgi:DNA-binding transcriptional ArsR family regulator
MNAIVETSIFPLTAHLEVLKAIAHPLRLQIMEFIHENEEVNVNKIYNTLHLEQSITSQHLKIMRNAGIVISRKKERFVYYAIDYTLLRGLGLTLQGF